MPCSNPQPRRYRDHGKSAGPQGHRRRAGDRSSGRDAHLSSEVFAGPQPHRAGLSQTHGASAHGGRADNPTPRAQDRSRRCRFQPTRMQKLLSPRGLCSNVSGIRSSVHYHFPTKEDLAAAVIKRYPTETADLIEQELKKDPNPVKVWVKAFRGTLHSEDRMCPAAVLGASSIDLPVEVSAEVKKFFKMCHDKLVEEGLSSDEASQLLATITGALVVANAVNDFAVYDRATREFTRARKAAPAKASRQRSK